MHIANTRYPYINHYFKIISIIGHNIILYRLCQTRHKIWKYHEFRQIILPFIKTLFFVLFKYMSILYLKKGQVSTHSWESQHIKEETKFAYILIHNLTSFLFSLVTLLFYFYCLGLNQFLNKANRFNHNFFQFFRVLSFPSPSSFSFDYTRFWCFMSYSGAD